MKNSLVIYYDMIEELEDFSDAQVGQILRAMIEYDKTGDLPKFTGSLKTAFKFLKTRIDRDKEKYQQIVEKRKIAGSMGGNQRVANQANACSCNQMQANQADSVSVSVSDSVIDNKVSKKEKEINNFEINTNARTCESYDDIFQEFEVSAPLKRELIEFIKHCQLNGKIITNEKLKNIIVRLDMWNESEEEKIKSVNNSIMLGYFDIKEGR